jgi:hypothetical protein
MAKAGLRVRGISFFSSKFVRQLNRSQDQREGGAKPPPLPTDERDDSTEKNPYVVQLGDVPPLLELRFPSYLLDPISSLLLVL